MCRDVDFVKFIGRDSENITIEVKGVTETYEVLKVVEFTSDRKRMSVVVKRQNDG